MLIKDESYLKFFEIYIGLLVVYYKNQSIHECYFCYIIVNFDYYLIICFTFHSRIFHLYGDVTITDEGLQDLSL
jgi:hypothetical protein